MLVVIVDYGLGNLRSVEGAVERVGHTPLVSSDAADLARADRLILPGVGAFADGMRNLAERGLVEPLTRQVVEARTPVLGICLGAQLMAAEGREFGVNRGLGWIDAVVERIAPADPSLRIPHIGWNSLRQVQRDPLFAGIPEDALFYFVHSFHIRCAAPAIVTGECDYGQAMAAVIHQDNICGTQFHPEKSQRHGLQLIENFLTGKP
jgi:glutamine amidotransferase